MAIRIDDPLIYIDLLSDDLSLLPVKGYRV